MLRMPSCSCFPPLAVALSRRCKLSNIGSCLIPRHTFGLLSSVFSTLTSSYTPGFQTKGSPSHAWRYQGWNLGSSASKAGTLPFFPTTVELSYTQLFPHGNWNSLFPHTFSAGSQLPTRFEHIIGRPSPLLYVNVVKEKPKVYLFKWAWFSLTSSNTSRYSTSGGLENGKIVQFSQHCVCDCMKTCPRAPQMAK